MTEKRGILWFADFDAFLNTDDFGPLVRAEYPPCREALTDFDAVSDLRVRNTENGMGLYFLFQRVEAMGQHELNMEKIEAYMRDFIPKAYPKWSHS
jgi:hypothetical protein